MSYYKDQESLGGLKANIVAFLTNLSFFVGGGLLFPIFVLIFEKNNEFVRKYAKQTLTLSIIIIIGSVLNLLIIIGTFIYALLCIILSVFQIIATINAFLGKEFEIPYVSTLTNKIFVD